jgi:hypothetical protein
LSGTTVSEVHRYPLRPPGFEEPLFPTPESKRAIADHLARASWLVRASEVRRKSTGKTAHRREEPAHVVVRKDGRAYVVRRCGDGRRRTHKRRVVRVLERWREVGFWWEAEPERRVDRLLFRVLLSGGAVVDLALERSSGEWIMVGVVD